MKIESSQLLPREKNHLTLTSPSSHRCKNAMHAIVLVTNQNLFPSRRSHSHTTERVAEVFGSTLSVLLGLKEKKDC